MSTHRVSEMRDQQTLLSDAALTTFRLNGQFLALADGMARPVGLTAAWWQVLGAALPQPLSVAGIAREMGISRQSVQRIADILVERDLAEYRPNPAHRRAKLLAPTSAGRTVISRLDPAHACAASRLADAVGIDRLSELVGALGELSAALDQLDALDEATFRRDRR